MMTTSDLRQVIEERVSVVEFAKTPIPDTVLADLLRLTQRAPTSFNTQPYRAVILRTAEDRTRLSEAMLASNVAKVKGAPLVVAFVADLEPSKEIPRNQQLMRDAGIPEAYINVLPTFLKGFSGEGTPAGLAWSYKQTTFAAATFIFAARALGLVTRPIEGFDQEKLKTALGLTERYSVPVVVSVGYPKGDLPAKSSLRFNPAEVFFEGTLGSLMSGLFEP
ncbi:hypothetical protein Poli38472_001469 [Pythium oligandrum]|uniref:Nitroreductase domain-containing protein n=1 Tax=Pythium oligandrum TaxID=41045 RepID=A0A8K1FT79_PYTOL|nr:hypothetical protein Poli38472_001469 [Pythium oligandrum]|eukprot:TMW69313.1 hypothetical protein Poli38472_001469 [Pythium oligandrum]